MVVRDHLAVRIAHGSVSRRSVATRASNMLRYAHP
jgi:hypothetical protein